MTRILSLFQSLLVSNTAGRVSSTLNGAMRSESNYVSFSSMVSPKLVRGLLVGSETHNRLTSSISSISDMAGVVTSLSHLVLLSGAFSSAGEAHLFLQSIAGLSLLKMLF